MTICSVCGTGNFCDAVSIYFADAEDSKGNHFCSLECAVAFCAQVLKARRDSDDARHRAVEHLEPVAQNPITFQVIRWSDTPTSTDAERVKPRDLLVGVGAVQLVEHIIADGTVAIYVNGASSIYPRHEILTVRREVTP